MIYEGADASQIWSSKNLDTLYWHHITFTLSGTSARFFINNTQTAATTM